MYVIQCYTYSGWKKSCTCWQMAYPNTMFHSYQWLPTGAGFLPSTVWLLVKLWGLNQGPKTIGDPDVSPTMQTDFWCHSHTLCHGQNLDYTHAYMYIYIYTYVWSSVQTPLRPLPPGHGFGSAIVLCPSPPVVWWGCGTVPFPSLWCGGCGTAHIYIYIWTYIYIQICVYK